MIKNTELEKAKRKLSTENRKRKKLEIELEETRLELKKVKADLQKFKRISKNDNLKRRIELEISNNKIAQINSRLSSLVLNLQYGILLEDENRKIVLINQKLCDLFAIPAKPESLHGLDCGIMAEDMKTYFKEEKKFIKDIETLLKKKKVKLSDIIELKNGRIFLRDYIPVWVDSVYAGHLWVYSDITEKHKAETELVEQKRFYEEILNNIPSDIAVFGPDHEYQFVNPIGISDPEIRKWIIGKRDEDYFQLKGKSLSLVEGRRKLFNDVVESKSQKEWEEVLTDKNGNAEYHLRRMLPIFDKEENLKMVIGYGLNITVIKRAQKLTEEASKNKERFLANMSHEIRTPMNGILGLVNHLLKTSVLDEQKEKLKLIEDSAQNLLIIINDVLDMEKIGSGNIIFENIRFSIFERLDSAVRIFKFGIKNKEISLLFLNNFNKDLFVIGDPTRFIQIVNNLLSNAIKFTHKGIIELKADIVSEKEEFYEFQISVKDTGIGIPVHKIDSIFKPFTQADAKTSRLYGGTGLGLNISKSLIELLGGRIRVESELGVGSTFSFTIKLKKSDQNRIPDKKEEILSLQNDLSGLRVLLVEDNEINQLLAKNTMESWGFYVTTANNGLEAIKELNNSNFDIILMDIQMPVMNGIDTSVYIRKMDSQVSKIPIVALTANAVKGEEKQYFEAGMNDFLIKPYKDEYLFAVINKNVNKKSFKCDETISLNTASADNPRIKLYDLKDLKEMSKNNTDFLKKMINLFIDTVPPVLAEIKEDYINQNWENIANNAHKIKPSVTIFNIIDSKQWVSEIEHNARNLKNLPEMENLILGLESNILDVISELKLVLEKL